MPRMSKQRKQEWSLFLNERNRITYNGLCRKCRNDCKAEFPLYCGALPEIFIEKENKKND